ncbi:MAG TPA: DUF1667 domain-containing protein [Euryarchaeota archaeon]|nr:DUF1667 domain-containing protein [Euryarchaeota archaeon]
MTRETRTITCIICPLGCEIEVTTEGDKIVEIKGYSCPKGKDYAIEEVLDPKRVIMTVVRVLNGDYPVVSVKTDRPIPKKFIERVMKETTKIQVQAPIYRGEIVAKNIGGSGANLMATKSVKRRSHV